MAERALLLLHNPTIRFILDNFSQAEPQLMTYFVDGICKNVVNQPIHKPTNITKTAKMMQPTNTFHWKESVRGMSFFAAKKVLVDINYRLYEELV